MQCNSAPLKGLMPPPCSLHYLDIVPELITGPPSLVCGPIDGREEAANGSVFQFVDWLNPR